MLTRLLIHAIFLMPPGAMLVSGLKSGVPLPLNLAVTGALLAFTQFVAFKISRGA
jgi:hypothetical protein